MNTTIDVGVVQFAMGQDPEKNRRNCMELTRQAASEGAQIVLPPELFDHPYFPQELEDERFFRYAAPASEHPSIQQASELCASLRIVMFVSFFEQQGPHYYNSAAMIDADGKVLGIYRKTHIPTGPGYQEKFYFRPGNTGFQVWSTRYGNIGAGICWDQWFPESARILSLKGAELLLFPSAIGSEPQAPELQTQEIWQRAMQGHCVANMIPLAASNRVGQEHSISFYGSSFVCDHFGAVLGQLSKTEEGVCVKRVDIARAKSDRATFGFFRDRRPELYSSLQADDETIISGR